jgi:hypothetical protein
VTYAYQDLPPSVPVGFQGPLSIGDTIIDFTWNANTEADLNHYELWADFVPCDHAYACGISVVPKADTTYQYHYYVLAGELAAASDTYQAAFRQYEKEMRPYVVLNQALGIKSANLMKSKEKSVFMWLLERVLRIAPGRMIQFFINRSTRRIHQAANAITLKDYSSCAHAR